MQVRVPPHNNEAEQSVLGGLMLEPSAWDNIADIVGEKDFYRTAHQKIFVAIQDLNRKGQPADALVVTSFLKDKQEIEEVGGAAYIAELLSLTPSTAFITNYAKIVHEKAVLRQLIQVTTKISEQAYEADFEDLDTFLDQTEGQIFNVSEKKTSTGLTPVKELVKVSLDIIDERYHKKAAITGISSGYAELDKMTAGFQPGDFIILAARPSMGKTALSLNMAQHAAIREKKSVAYFSIEMGKEQLMMRILASEARVSMSNVRLGNIPDAAWPNLIQSASVVSEAPMYIDDTSGISPFEIRSKARRLKRQYGLDMIFIDYLQIMDLKQKVESRERIVSEMSRTLKAIARELKVPVIALSQLNRSVEGRSERKPMLSDLRESGSIEQDADLIMMLYREEYYDRDNVENKGIAEVLIQKQRNGPTGSVKLKWFSEYGRFENLEPSRDIPPVPPAPTGPRGAPSAGGIKRIPNFAP
ncbi:MAG: replicative DNA helicase [Bdellovibrionales bacterium]